MNIDEQGAQICFNSANFEIEKIDGNTPDALSRFEFLEIVMRLAKDTYMRANARTKSLAQALDLFMDEILLKKDTSEEWTGFRKKHLWTLPVCDLVEPNKDGLQQLYTSFHKERKSYMDMKDCRDLFHTTTQILKTEAAVDYCFAMSKTTII